jgi:hypothetical protein
MVRQKYRTLMRTSQFVPNQPLQVHVDVFDQYESPRPALTYQENHTSKLKVLAEIGIVKSPPSNSYVDTQSACKLVVCSLVDFSATAQGF